jgi:hypothetical protein
MIKLEIINSAIWIMYEGEPSDGIAQWHDLYSFEIPADLAIYPLGASDGTIGNVSWCASENRWVFEDLLFGSAVQLMACQTILFKDKLRWVVFNGEAFRDL